MTVIPHQPEAVWLSEATHVPATADGFIVTDAGATFPRAEVAELARGDGTRAVDLMIVSSAGATAASFTPAEARRLAAALSDRADRAEQAQP